MARARSERGEVVLRRRGASVLELRVNGVFVMDTAETTTETALARAALEAVPAPRSVLVGGLGLGFTLKEVLADHRVERVVVAEIEEALVTWFRDGTVPHGPTFLADERLSVAVADVRQVVEECPPESLDLALVDVDNGPDFLVFDNNAAIYASSFLERVKGSLRLGGTLVIWSSSESPQLKETLASVFGSSTSRAHPVSLQGRDDVYWSHVARRTGSEEER